MSDVVADLAIRLSADYDPRGAAQARGDMDRSAKSFQNVGKQAGIMGAATLGAFTAAGAAGFSAVKSAASFETTMRQVAVATNEPASKLQELSRLAKQMGADTTFSAQESGDAMLELAKGGLTAAQIQGGALSSTLTLAAAGGLQLGEAASYTVTGLAMFNLEAAQASSVAAALAGAANASQASVQDMGSALSQVGPGAVNAGLSLQETTGVLAAFAKSGILGSDAGTSLKTMLTRLVPTTTESAKAMRKLGLDFTDASGAILPIGDVAEQLRKKLGGLSQEQRTAAMATIFGSDATRAATVLMQQGADGIAGYVKATSDKTQAEQLAKAATDGTAGAMEQASGAIENAKLAIGEALSPAVVALSKHLQTAAGKVEGVVGWLQENEAAARAFAVGGITLLIAGIVGVNVALLALAANPVTLTIMAIVAAVAVLAGGITYAYQESQQFRVFFWQAMQAATQAVKFLAQNALRNFDLMISGAAMIFGWVPGIGDKLKAANRAFDQFQADVLGTFDSISEKAGEKAAEAARGTAKEWTAAANSGIKSGAISVSEAAASVMANAGRSAAVAAAAGGRAAGVEFSLGFAQGVIRRQALVVANAMALGRAAIGGVRAVGDSHSPSRVMIQIGQDYGTGLAIGIENSQAAVRRAATALGGAATLTVEDMQAAAQRAAMSDVDRAAAAATAASAALTGARDAGAAAGGRAVVTAAEHATAAAAQQRMQARLNDTLRTTQAATRAARDHALAIRRQAEAASEAARRMPTATKAQRAAKDAAEEHARKLHAQAREADRAAVATNRAGAAAVAQARSAVSAAAKVTADRKKAADEAARVAKDAAEELARVEDEISRARVALADAAYAEMTAAAKAARDAEVAVARSAVDAQMGELQRLATAAQGLRGAFASNVTEGSSLADLFGSGDTRRGVHGALAQLQQQVDSARSFAAQIEALNERDLNGGLLQQIAGADNGAVIAAEMLAAGDDIIAQFNSLTDELAVVAATGLDQVATDLFGQGAAGIAGFIDGIRSGFPELGEVGAEARQILSGILGTGSLSSTTLTPTASGGGTVNLEVTVRGDGVIFEDSRAVTRRLAEELTPQVRDGIRALDRVGAP